MVTLLSVSLKYQTESLISALGLLLKGLKALCIEMIHATQDYAHNNINTTGNPSLEGDLTGPFMSYISLSVIAADGEYQREANNNP